MRVCFNVVVCSQWKCWSGFVFKLDYWLLVGSDSRHPMLPSTSRGLSEKSLPSLPDYFEVPHDAPAYTGVPVYRRHNPDEDGIEFEAPHVKAQLF
jgi:hypothetical protein